MNDNSTMVIVYDIVFEEKRWFKRFIDLLQRKPHQLTEPAIQLMLDDDMKTPHFNLDKESIYHRGQVFFSVPIPCERIRSFSIHNPNEVPISMKVKVFDHNEVSCGRQVRVE